MAAGTPFLTAIGQDFAYPERISGDHVLRRAAADDTFQQVIHEDAWPGNGSGVRRTTPPAAGGPGDAGDAPPPAQPPAPIG